MAVSFDDFAHLQKNIQETFEIDVSNYELFFKDDEEDLLIEDEASLDGILTLLGE